MSELFGFEAPWWAYTLVIIGVISLIGVIGALFFPDWPTPDYRVGFDAEPGSEDFLRLAAGFLNVPLLPGGEAEILQNGDQFYPAMLEAIRGAKDTISFEVYIFDADEVGREFMDAFMERARAGVEVRVLVDAFGSWKLKRKFRDELRHAGVRIERFRTLGLSNLVRVYRRTHRRAIVIDGRLAFTGGAAPADALPARSRPIGAVCTPRTEPFSTSSLRPVVSGCTNAPSSSARSPIQRVRRDSEKIQLPLLWKGGGVGSRCARPCDGSNELACGEQTAKMRCVSGARSSTGGTHSSTASRATASASSSLTRTRRAASIRAA